MGDFFVGLVGKYLDFFEELGKMFFVLEGNGVCSLIIGFVVIRKIFFNLFEEGKIDIFVYFFFYKVGMIFKVIFFVMF